MSQDKNNKDFEDEEEFDDSDKLDELEDDCEMSPLAQAAVALHEIFLSLTEAGFEDYDALRIVAWVISDQGLGE